jgi:hypothetical protein
MSMVGDLIREFLLVDYHKTSQFVADVVEVGGEELDKNYQLVGEVANESFVTKATWSLPFWEFIFNIPEVPTDSNELRRARILSYTYHHQRIRRVDIQSIVRQFISGPKAFVLQAYNSTNKISVSNIDEFSAGDNIFIGSETSKITKVDPETTELELNSFVSPYPGALVSRNSCLIVEDFTNYTFSIYINQSFVEHLQSLIDAVNRAKPAHLAWKLWGSNGALGYYDDHFSLLDDIDITGDFFLLYQNP